MLKLLTTFIASWLLVQCSFAQIQLDALDYHKFNNQYFRGFIYVDFTQVETTPAGANQFWDYFLLNEDFQDTLTIVKSDLTPFFSSFPESEFAITTNNLSYFYESLTSEGVKIEGRAVYDPILNSQIITPFESYGFSLPYPINFGDNYQFGYKHITQNVSFLPNLDSSKATTDVDVSINVDASGMLTTPSGTFEVLRFRQTSTSIDSLYLWNEENGWINYSILFDTTVTDLFYTKEIGASLLTITTRPNTGITGISYLKGFVINTIENAIIPRIKIFPQPAVSEIWVEAEKNYTAHLIDLQGRTVKEIQLIKGFNRIDRQSLTNGIYFLRCFEQSGALAGVKKVVFSK